MHGVVPRVLWQRTAAPDENNRIAMALRSLLVRKDDRVILVDTGIGDWQERKFRNIYKNETSDALSRTLRGQGLVEDDITDIILTHLHFDHAGGLVRKTETGLAPAYPNARLWIQARQWNWARNPSCKDRASFRNEYLDVIEHDYQCELVDNNVSIVPGIEVLACQGHTPGMQCVLLRRPDRTVFFAADLVPLGSHLRLPWLMAYDVNPLETIKEKERLLQQACRENWLIVFQHDPVFMTGTVLKETDKYILQPHLTVERAPHP